MKVAVIGAGTMGSGIAQACALASHDVKLVDLDDAALQRGQAMIKTSLGRLARKEAISEDAVASALEKIHTSASFDALADSELVIEAVYEALDVKREVWSQLGRLTSPEAILATNTSSLSVTEIASFSGRPERFCGLHFFNPVAMMPLVEIVRAMRTDPDVIEAAVAFIEGLGKTGIVCEDKPGFIVNRLLVPYINDAVHALSEGVASAEDIDKAMKLGANMPIGPLALADLVGLDVGLAAGQALLDEFGDPKFRPAPLIKQMVRAGKLGRKSGEGFYRYDEGGSR